MEQTKIIKFENGETIVAVVEDAENYRSLNLIKILYPIEVFSQKNVKGEVVVEQFSLKPWISLSDETLYEISTSNITTMVNLKDEFLPGYQRMVDHFYFTENEEEVIEEEEELELLMDYWDAKSNNKIN